MEWERGSRCGCGLSTESSVWDRSIGGLARVGGGGPRLGVWPGVLGVCCDESSRQRVWYAVLPGRGGCGVVVDGCGVGGVGGVRGGSVGGGGIGMVLPRWGWGREGFPGSHSIRGVKRRQIREERVQVKV